MNDMYILPQDLLPQGRKPERFYLHPYQAGQSPQRNKILLKHNMINFLLNGEKIFHYAGKRTSIVNTQFVILRAGNCLTTERNPPGGTFRSILFFFEQGALTEFFAKYVLPAGKKRLEANAEQRPFVVLEKDEFISNYTQSLGLIAASGAARDAMLQAKFDELMLYLLDKHPSVFFALQDSYRHAESDFEIRRAVEENITGNLSLEELAFLCSLSASTFKRRFVKIYNCAPSQYFLQRRMELASALLLNNEHPGEVFFKVGYETHSSFSQSFKQMYGISPNQFRQQHLGDQQQLLADQR